VSTELDLGALRALADVSAKMGYKVRLTPAELAALLAAAGEREALRADVERLRAYIASDAQCPCCGRSDECASHCTFLQDDGDVCAAMEHARSVLAALAPAAAKDARSPTQSDGGAT
jgi:hypothetical protein